VGAGSVNVTGLVETRALLKRFEPDLLKRLDARLNAVARDLKSGAEASFARTGAGGSAYRMRTRSKATGFVKSVTASGGSVSPGQKWSSSPGVLAAIFEFADGVRSSKPENVARTKSLIATLNSRYGSTGRFLWAAWDERKESALASIKTEVEAVEAEYTARLR